MRTWYKYLFFVITIGLLAGGKKPQHEHRSMSAETQQKLLQGLCPLWIKKGQTPSQVLLHLKYNIRKNFEYYELTAQEQEQLHFLNQKLTSLPLPIARVPVTSSRILWV